MEEYLTEIRNTPIRKQLSKFRLSNHTLAIEVGRHQGVHDPNLRHCTFCDDVAECEIHFLINCPVYSHLRTPFFEEIICSNPNFQYLSDKEKFINVMINSRNMKLASFVHKSFELRNFLVARPKCHDQSSDRIERCIASQLVLVGVVCFGVYFYFMQFFIFV